MKTEALVKLALATSLLGLFSLYILSESLEPKLIPISEINEKMFDSYARISGQITSARETEGLYILRVEDGSGAIDVVIYKEKEKISFSGGQEVEVIGKVSEFRGKLQLEAVEVRMRGQQERALEGVEREMGGEEGVQRMVEE